MKTIDLMQRVLGASTIRKQVIDNNIANVSTPHFKRSQVTFESELNRALSSETYQPEITAKRSRKKHMVFHVPQDYRKVNVKTQVDYATYQNNNGNNVDIDREMVDSAKNSMHYLALAQKISQDFKKLNFVIKG